MEILKRRVANTSWVRNALMALTVLFMVFAIVWAVSLIVYADDDTDDMPIVSINFGFGMGMCLLGCLVVLGIAPDLSQTAAPQYDLKSDRPPFESKIKLASDEPKLFVIVDEPLAKHGDESLRAVGKDEGSGIQSLPTLNTELLEKAKPVESVAPTASTEPDRALESVRPMASAAPAASIEPDRALETVKPTESMVPSASIEPERDASQIDEDARPGDALKASSLPVLVQSERIFAAKPGAATTLEAATLGASSPPVLVQPDDPKDPLAETKLRAKNVLENAAKEGTLVETIRKCHVEALQSAQILEAAEQETAEVKSIMGDSLDKGEQDVLKMIVTESKKDEALQQEALAAEEALQKEALAAEEQEKALILLSSAISSRDTIDLREALDAASEAEVPSSHEKVVEAKSVLSELDAMLIAHTELVKAMSDADVGVLKSSIKSARELGVDSDVLSTAESKVRSLEAIEAARAKLDAAIASREVDNLLNALDEASKAGLRSDAPRVVLAKATMRELDALKELEAAMQTASDISRLRKAVEAAQEAGVVADSLAAGEARVKELEEKLAATEKLEKASAAREVHLLKAALAQATSVGISDSDTAFTEATRILAEVEAAAAALAAEERRQAAEKELEVAAASRNIDLIRAALEGASEAGVTESPQLQEAQKILSEEVAKEEARQELSAVLRKSGIDVVEMQAALEKATAAGIGLDEEIMVSATDTLAKEKAKLAAMAELEACIEEGEKVDPKDPFNLEKARDRLVAGIAGAREVGFTDTNATLRQASMKRRHLHNLLQDLLGATRVFCRVRPTNSREKKLESPVVVNVVEGMSVEVEDEDGEQHKFEFDAAFGPTSTQEQIFTECRDLVQSVLDGYNITIFAYGQTGAGKTFTMMGADDPPELKGVCPRTIETLFEAIDRESARYDITVTAFMVEVYCSKVNDLGAGEEEGRRSQLHSRGGHSMRRQSSHKDSGGVKVRCIDDKVTLEGVNERPIRTATELFALLEEGNSHKKVTATAMNAGSSRSHTILGINVLVANKDTGRQHAGKILLVDLAGSERLKKSEVTGPARKEAIEINKSLTALGDVISAITLGKRVPYRNHTLTMLMSDSLGGTAKTLMFVNASPALDNADETVMALNFATRAKTITKREAAVVALQAARRGIIDRRKTKTMSQKSLAAALKDV